MLAIGIVVDDAIVVVEAVEHHIEEGMSPRDATVQAMREVSGPVIAVALVLTAVFMPCAFISGITGSFFKQFAVTVSVSTVISAFNSLTLSPALAAILLKPTTAKKDIPARVLDFTLGWFFRLIQLELRQRDQRISVRRGNDAARQRDRVGAVRRAAVADAMGLYAPADRLSSQHQDKGYLLISRAIARRGGRRAHRGRGASTSAKSSRAPRKARSIISSRFPANRSRLSVVAPNAGQFFIILKPFDERRDPQLVLSGDSRIGLRRRIAAEVPEAKALLFGPPPLQGLGNASGFRVMVEDRGDLG